MRSTRLRGARTNNLRSLDLDLEPGSLVAIAGPSGAGKSSLAFGTLYAEGQRRYVESFSAYARQFLERLARPPVDELDPVPAGIAVDRQAPVKTSRSTVATMTDLADYAKSLWARISVLHCSRCSEPVVRESPSAAAEQVLRANAGARVVVTYPMAVRDGEHFLEVRESLLGAGYRRVRVDGNVLDLDQVRPSDVLGAEAAAPKRKRTVKRVKRTKRAKRASKETATTSVATLEVVADRTVARTEDRSRLVEALEAAMQHGSGRADVVVEGAATMRFSRGLHCARCDLEFRDASPGLFSFNNPIGACESCRGFGRTIAIDWERVLPDSALSFAEGAIKPWNGRSTQWERRQLKKHCAAAGVPMDVPIGSLTPEQRAWLIDGDALGWPRGWWGLAGWFKWLEQRAYKMHVRVLLSRYRKYETCEACKGGRLKPEALLWRIDGATLPDFCAMPVSEALGFVERVAQRYENDPATLLLLRECAARLRTLLDVGLGYLTLDRQSRTLSGGEAQRVALTSALSASLTGAMIVLDEPTSGLHPRDVERLFNVVRKLASGDNLTLVVEHDLDVLRGVDRVIELGPSAGEQGGQVVFDGPPAALAAASTATGRALSRVEGEPKARRRAKRWLTLRGAHGHNLQGVDLRIPIGAMTCITGVSGSGKSSLVLETLFPAVARALRQSNGSPLPFDALEGVDAFASVLSVDQSPLGRTSRGNPGTYLKVWDIVRRRFAAEKLARERGYGPGYFSFNVVGGRCEACKGEGAETVEMQFLADVQFSCPECGGRRFSGPVLDVRYRGKNIAEVLDMTATEALAHLAGDLDFEDKLRPLLDVGLGYLRLGQPLSTLSGGEAQRLKLAEAVSRAVPGSLLILDEPTVGLHADDVQPLLEVLEKLVQRGDTIVVVEHDMRVAASSDWIVELGPGAGAEGGHIVVSGTPEDVANTQDAPSAPFLTRALHPLAHAPAHAHAHAKHPRPTADETEHHLTHAIQVRGAREHNLRDVSVDIPREKLVVVTGPSGSGKSTLAFDVVFAEGQRRYLETLSPYARQYLPQLPRPAVDRVSGVPPSVSLEQRITRGGRNSTVATLTEVAHYLRLLYARAGLLHCPDCRVPIAPRDPVSLARDLRLRFPKEKNVTVLAPVVRGRKGLHREVFERALKDGVDEARVDGSFERIRPGMKLARYKEHDIDLVLTRTYVHDDALERSLARALSLGDGTARVLAAGQELLVSSRRACPSCGTGFPELDPRFFSFNTRQGACEECEGSGTIERVIGRGKSARIEEEPCETCRGTRLSPLASSVTIDGRRLPELLALSVSKAKQEIPRILLRGRDAEVGRAPLVEVERRLAFLEQVGLGYLGLDRGADSLSGGETQRVRLAAQLGSGLTGVLYVLDEPTIGLHPRDTHRLLAAVRDLVTKGNTVLVVEHDADTIRAADHIIDIGPGGGHRGGDVVAQGTPEDLFSDESSVTGQSLSRALPVPVRRKVDSAHPRLELVGATEHNLRDVTLRAPLGRLVAVTGVSGSGKSTLVRNVLLRATRHALGLVGDRPGKYRELRGHAHVQRAVEIDQSPIGRTPRSVPATYVGVWDEIRKLLAATPEGRARGYGPSRFSFNVDGGRCKACAGQGALTVEMAFLPDVLVPCEACGGLRFELETLAVKMHGLDAGQILDLEIEEAARVFSSVPKVARPLDLLTELGLGYLRLGQASNTLSGGEAQRLKLVAELSIGNGGGRTLYVMDEPTTGLHREDVARLVSILSRLVDRGDSVVLIEHHPDVIYAADWVIDLGPEGGEGGGRIVAEGTPEDIMRSKVSHTGAVLRSMTTSSVRTNASRDQIVISDSSGPAFSAVPVFS